MHKVWVSVVLAAFLEAGWVIGLKHADTAGEWLLTLIAIISSFYLLLRAGYRLAVGTVYAVFVGLGTTFTVLSDILLFGSPIVLSKCLLLGLLLLGVIGLKLLDQPEKKEVI